MTMRVLFVAAIVVALAGVVAAECPNACSGHGDCSTNHDFCECYKGYLGADCSQRLCAFGLAYLDGPTGDLNHDNVLSGGGPDYGAANLPAGVPAGSSINPTWAKTGWWERHPAALYGASTQSANLPFYVRQQEGHFYAECSNRGICNRESGLCECFTGYEGTACNRTVCVNDCSGHGTCERLTEITPSHLHYRLWDMDKTQYCKCDGGYFGQDCSQRACMKNDDPLTETTSRKGYNNGLAEQPETQIVEIRCPYNGLMLDPSISLLYTDTQFSNDVFETAAFDPTDGAAALAALKGLPNQVLSDFSVDGTTVMSKVTSVTATTLIADNFLRLTVVFDGLLGDVPMLSGRSYFKCQGGLGVNHNAGSAVGIGTMEPTWVGDGPAYDFDIVIDHGAATATVEDINGNVFNNLAPVAIATPWDFANNADLSTFTRETEKVSFAVAGETFGAGVVSRLMVRVTPVITARNSLYTLQDITEAVAGPYTSSVYDSTGAVIGGDSISLAVDLGGTGWDNAGAPVFVNADGNKEPLYDTDIKFVGLDGTNVEVYLFGEIIGITTLAAFGGAKLATGMTANSDHAIAAETDLLAGDITLTGIDGAGDYGTMYLPKDPIQYSAISTTGDSITVTYAEFKPPSYPLSLVFKIVDVSTDPDKYTWKVAGDDVFEDNAGDDMSTTAGPLPGLATYLATRYPDDPMRAQLNSIEIAWSAGDLDARICTGEGAFNYVQLGTAGLNDSPECSNRGICDYNTGICKCFKGYAGIDCTDQNALALGSA